MYQTYEKARVLQYHKDIYMNLYEVSEYGKLPAKATLIVVFS